MRSDPVSFRLQSRMTAAHQSDLPILVLAAGQSRRMRGRDKLLEPVEGIPLIARQTDRALAVTSGPVFVTLPPAPHARHDALLNSGAVRIEVPDAIKGLSASLRAGLGALPPDAPAVMVLLADLPDLTSRDLAQVLAAVDLTGGSKIWRATTEGGAPGHPVVFAAEIFALLMQLTGDSGGAEVMKAHQNVTTFVPLPGNRARLDLDTPEDWAAWRTGKTKNGEH